MFKNILVPTDGSQFSQDTARRAVSFAKEAGARLTVFYAKHHTPEYFWGKGAWVHLPEKSSLEEFAEQEAQNILKFVDDLCKEAGVPCTRMTLTSDVVHDAIIEAATQCGCDLIFMASHGRRGLNALVIGSETHKVLTHSKIPVLVYR